jgi:hypothetical protein
MGKHKLIHNRLCGLQQFSGESVQELRFVDRFSLNMETTAAGQALAPRSFGVW